MSQTLIFIVIANIDVMVAESTGLAQVEDPMASTSADYNALQTSAGEPGVVESVTVPDASEATTITVPEVSAMISALTEPAAGLVSAPNELASTSVDIIERGSGSAPVGLSPAMDIMKELAHQMVQQFFTSMKSCIGLVLSRGSSFKSAWMLLRIRLRTSVVLEAQTKLGRI